MGRVEMQLVSNVSETVCSCRRRQSPKRWISTSRRQSVHADGDSLQNVGVQHLGDKSVHAYGDSLQNVGFQRLGDSLCMQTEKRVSKTLDSKSIMTWLIVQEDFSASRHIEDFRTYAVSAFVPSR
jgi:hypothetical protein